MPNKMPQRMTARGIANAIERLALFTNNGEAVEQLMTILDDLCVDADLFHEEDGQPMDHDTKAASHYLSDVVSALDEILFAKS